jgi:NTP pyrophosphatase (non-canonical NTP hydrolase)
VEISSAIMAAVALSSSFHKRRQKELGQPWKKERGHLWRFSLLTQVLQCMHMAAVAEREVACGDGRDATRPGFDT